MQLVRIVAPSTTPLPCADKIDNCQSYGQNVCSEPRYTAWVLDNCQYFCRQCSGKKKIEIPKLFPLIEFHMFYIIHTYVCN